MKRVLVFGASSFIGSNLVVYLRRHYRVYGTYATRAPKVDGVPCFRLPLTPSAPILEILNILKPDSVVYCPAYVKSPQNEKDSERALFVNAEAPAFIARAMELRGGRFIYLSSSKVFSGNQGDYGEGDPVDPVGVYGMTKARAEELILESKSSFVFRLGTIFGFGPSHRPSMFNRLLSDLRSASPVSYISDEYRTFYSVLDVAHAVGVALDGLLEGAGLYHLTQPDKHTYYSFGKLVANLFGLNSSALSAVAGSMFSSNLTEKAGPRGHDLSLKGGTFEENYSLALPTLERSILALRRQLQLGTQ